MRNSRKRIWIDSFQTGLLVRIVVYCLIFQLCALFFSVFCELLQASFETLGAEWAFISSPLVRMLLAFLILLPPLTLDAIRFAHRLVGPLYRFRVTIQAIAAGEPVDMVRLRKGDMLLDFRDAFNKMLERLQEQGAVIIKDGRAQDGASTDLAATLPATKK